MSAITVRSLPGNRFTVEGTRQDCVEAVQAAQAAGTLVEATGPVRSGQGWAVHLQLRSQPAGGRAPVRARLTGPNRRLALGLAWGAGGALGLFLVGLLVALVAANLVFFGLAALAVTLLIGYRAGARSGGRTISGTFQGKIR